MSEFQNKIQLKSIINEYHYNIKITLIKANIRRSIIESIQHQIHQVVEFQSGGSQNILIDNHNNIYAFGKNELGQCDIGIDIQSSSKIMQISFNESSTLILYDNNYLSIFGSTQNMVLTIFDYQQNINQIACSEYQIHFLTNQGQVISSFIDLTHSNQGSFEELRAGGHFILVKSINVWQLNIPCLNYNQNDNNGEIQDRSILKSFFDGDILMIQAGNDQVIFIDYENNQQIQDLCNYKYEGQLDKGEIAQDIQVGSEIACIVTNKRIIQLNYEIRKINNKSKIDHDIENRIIATKQGYRHGLKLLDCGLLTSIGVNLHNQCDIPIIFDYKKTQINKNLI